MKPFKARTLIATILFCIGAILIFIFIDKLTIWVLGTILILASIALFLRKNTPA